MAWKRQRDGEAEIGSRQAPSSPRLRDSGLQEVERSQRERQVDCQRPLGGEMLRPRDLEVERERERQGGKERGAEKERRDPETDRQQGWSWGSLEKTGALARRGGAAWGLGGWRRREGASRAGGPLSSGRAQSGAASCSRRGAGSRASTPPPPP